MKKRISAVLAASIMTTNMSPVINVFANETIDEGTKVEAPYVVNATSVKPFDLTTYSNFESYNETYKLSRADIKSIKNNGGKYGSSSIDKAIDGNLSTHWETGTPNSSTFTNEVTFEFNDIETVDRMAYLVRQDSTDKKGFPLQFDIYASLSGNDEDFKLVSTGKHESSGSMLEFKFDAITAKKIKFVFKEANRDWASASEFWFYREDKQLAKMNKIFTDIKMSSVSEEFKSIDKLEALENESKNHPFFNDYKETFELARQLIESGEITESNYKINKFNPYYTNAIEKYDKTYRVPINSISNNSENCCSEDVLANAIDNDVNTHWKAGRGTSDTFKNEVTLNLDSPQVINRLTYKSRLGGKGFATDFDILVSPVSKGDNFVKVTNGKHNVTEDILEVKFNPVNAKRVKFVFNKEDRDWATIADIRLYKEDALSEKMYGLFTNGLMNEISKEYNSQESLENLKKEVVNHPLKEEFNNLINRAEQILNKTLQETRTVAVEQYGDMRKHAKENLKFGFGNNNQPTGVYARPGETVIVYVDADEKGPLPSLMFSQQEGSYSNWGRSVGLSPGKNIITVPEVPKDSNYKHDVTKGGPIYIVNPYTKEEQPNTPIIRFENANRFPLLTENTNNEDFIKELKEYKKAIDEDKEANPNVVDRKIIDTFEFVSKHIVFTGTATGAYEAYVNKGVIPTKTVQSWNTYMKELMRYYGLDGNNLNDDPKYIRENVRLAQPYGYMYAAGDHTGVQGDVMTSLLVPFEDDKDSNWGITHEIGHRMDTSKRLYGESTNNMLPLYMDHFYNKNEGHVVPYDKIYKNVMDENSNVYVNGDYFERIGPFWQLELYHPNYWGELNSLYRERDKDIYISDGENKEKDKTKYIVEFSSEILGADLSEYFARHGFPVTDEVKKDMESKYKKPDKKLWYINDGLVKYKGNGFVEGVWAKVNVTNQENKVKLSFNISDNGKDDLLGYEIVKDGKVIGFTDKNSFVDENSNFDKNQNYKIIAYDRKLNTIKEVEIASYSPKLKVDNELILKLDQNFDPKQYVKALNYKGEDITSDVKVDSNVDITKKGNYEIKYTIVNEGSTVSTTLPVRVVSDYTYASDIKEKSAQTGWGGLRKDKAPSNTPIKLINLGEVKIYEKGLGLHANASVVYNLEGKGYSTFESYIGIDQEMAASNTPSALFKIYLDDKLVYESSEMRSNTPNELVKIDLGDAKEIKLVTDSNGNNSGDHTVWADAKFINNNTKPTLTKPAGVSTKVGEEVDLNQVYKATDIEDGDITSKVKVEGDVDFNKPGKYKITYSVTDSDNNTEKAIREVKVVDMNDYKYISDIDWKSANAGWGSVKKDKSISENELRLTDENGDVATYQKGIGTHSKSTIIYDLSKDDYGYFTSYIGVDRQMFGTVGSITFEVYLDNEKVYDSGVMNSKDAQRYVEVNLKDAKELKLVVTDSGNGIGSDHATWADAKLHFANQKEV